MIPNAVANSNNIIGCPDPEVGMGVTQYLYADRYPFTVVEVISPQEIVVQADQAIADPNKTNRMGHQNWLIIRDLAGPKYNLTKRKDGKWRLKGNKVRSGPGFVVGKRDYYYCWEL